MSKTTRRVAAVWSTTLVLGRMALPSAAQSTVKVGIVGPFSGPFAHYGTLFKAGTQATSMHRAASSRVSPSSSSTATQAAPIQV